MLNKDIYLNIPINIKTGDIISMAEVITILKANSTSNWCIVSEFGFDCPTCGGCSSCIVNPDQCKNILKSIKKKSIQEFKKCQS
jgi:hypothetical protein